MFNHDPTGLQHIPLSEYRKRLAYMRLVKDTGQKTSTGPGGVIVEKTGVDIEEDAVIIE